jgi:hypothetical protein
MHHQYENYKTIIPTQQCMSIVLEAYWTIHKPINFSFPLLDHYPKCYLIN